MAQFFYYFGNLLADIYQTVSILQKYGDRTNNNIPYNWSLKFEDYASWMVYLLN